MENVNSDEQQVPVFLFPEEYFTTDGFMTRFDNDVKRLRGLITGKTAQSIIKSILNQFMGACFAMIKDKKILLHMHLEFYQTLAYYGEIYDSEETFENILRDYERPERRAILSKNPGRTNIVIGDALFKYYGLKNDKNGGWYKHDAFEIITRAKFHILTAYIHSVEGTNKLKETDQSYCLTLLAGCFLHLSRWFEPLYYTGLMNLDKVDDPNYEYVIVRNLEQLKEKTCLDYNGQLLLRILDGCIHLRTNPLTDERRRQQAIEFETKCLADIEQAKLSIDKLRMHKNKVDGSKKKRNAYFRYCIEHQLFLNEHALFCSCTRAVGDRLNIKTQHTHTQMAWVNKFEYVLELLMADFALARTHLYESEKEKGPAFFYKKENSNDNALQLRKDALLKEAFKLCYSILDKIAHGIFEVLEIDIEKYLREKAEHEGKQASHVYFLSMWDLYPFQEQDFINNLYLISLKSIAKDLDRTDYSALKSFKKYRNAIEHKFLFIKGPGIELTDGLNHKVVVKRADMILRTRLLMILTKSAIFSFAYLVRRQSKAKEVAQKNIFTTTQQDRD